MYANGEIGLPVENHLFVDGYKLGTDYSKIRPSTFGWFYKFSSYYSKIGYQVWITINLVRIIPKLDDQFCMIINLVQIISKLEDSFWMIINLVQIIRKLEN